jgi:molecular chaperone HscB
MDSSTPPVKCTACNQPMRSPVYCHNCRAINPVQPGTDYFAIFSLPRRYALDEKELHRRFLNMTREIHPDRFATSAQETVNLTTRLAAQINDAYNVLKDPMLRAEYLLQQAGGKRASEDKSVPGDVLTRNMELREQIEAAQASGDDQALEQCRRLVAEMHREAHQAVASLAERVADQPQEEQLAELRAHLNAVKYVRNLQELLP